jgi:hypothetical protein
LQAKNNKYLKSVHVEFTEKKLQYLFSALGAWLANIDKKTINDAIKKTINRPKPKDKSQKSNAGGSTTVFSALGTNSL